MPARHHDAREPAATAPSAKVLHDDAMPISHWALQYALLLLLTIFTIAAVAVLATRSVWIDEAMLLRNVYESTIADFLHPLRYYDQASPFLSLVFLKFISEIAGIDIFLFRIMIFGLSIICITPLILQIKQKFGINYLIIAMIMLVGNTYNLLFYFTEIKHYFFEIIGTLLFLYWLINYIDNFEKYTKLYIVWIPIFAAMLGFSTILLMVTAICFVIFNCFLMQTQKKSFVELLYTHRYIFIYFPISILLIYLHMKYITTFQINNTWSESDYGSKGFKRDAIEFYYIVMQAYTLQFFIISATASVASLFINVNSICYKLNVYFVILSLLIVILKFTGFYPVIYSRHIAWIIPINIIIIVLLLHQVTFESHKIFRLIGYGILIGLSANIIIQSKNLFLGVTAEHQDNNSLYAALTQMDSSDVLVMGNARPSLEIYQMKIPALSRHRYFGIMPEGDLSAIKLPGAAFVGGHLRKEEFGHWQLSELPQTRSFLVLISHADPIDREPPREQIGLLRNSLDKKGCTYVPIFTAHRVQILKASCAQPGADGAGAPLSRAVPLDGPELFPAPERQNRRRIA
jgi:hypothetical protein